MKHNTSTLGVSRIGGRKKYKWHFNFAKKDNTIRNIEIAVACIVAFIAGSGIYGLLS